MRDEKEILKNSLELLEQEARLEKQLKQAEDDFVKKITKKPVSNGYPKWRDLTPKDYVYAHLGEEAASAMEEVKPVSKPSKRFLFWAGGALLLLLSIFLPVILPNFEIPISSLFSIPGVVLLVAGFVVNSRHKKYQTWKNNVSIYGDKINEAVEEANKILQEFTKNSKEVLGKLEIIIAEIKNDLQGKELMGNYYNAYYIKEMISLLSGGLSWIEALERFDNRRHQENLELIERNKVIMQEKELAAMQEQTQAIKEQNKMIKDNQKAQRNSNQDSYLAVRMMCGSCKYGNSCRRPRTTNCASYVPK